MSPIERSTQGRESGRLFRINGCYSIIVGIGKWLILYNLHITLLIAEYHTISKSGIVLFLIISTLWVSLESFRWLATCC